MQNETQKRDEIARLYLKAVELLEAIGTAIDTQRYGTAVANAARLRALFQVASARGLFSEDALKGLYQLLACLVAELRAVPVDFIAAPVGADGEGR